MSTAAKSAAQAAVTRYDDQNKTSDNNRLSQISSNSKSSSHKRSRAHIGPWQLGRTLGRGSSGRVRLAKHSETGQLAAVKILPKALVDSKNNAHQAATGASSTTGASHLPYGIEREVIIMKLIEHPNIMGLYDVWENKDELYLVLEYIEGGELFDYLISRGRLSEREAIHYFRQICYGVDYCHQFNICHRDLKPENLLLDKHRDIKIADFGMAALETQGRMLETSCGSPHYASPEIVAGKNYHGAPSDIWSCGIILFALLTGHLPFDDDNIRKLLLKVQSGKYVMPHYLSPEAKDLISRMLCVRPEDRISMRGIFAHPLLAKYPSRRIPAANTDMVRLINASHPVASLEDIDMEILRNLKTLWHRDSTEQIIQQLLSPSPNPEKTFYCLLVRYRDTHSMRKSTRRQGANTDSGKRNSVAAPLAVTVGSSTAPSPPRPIRAVPARQSPLRHRRTTSQSSRRSGSSLRAGPHHARGTSRSNSRYSIGSVGSRRKHRSRARAESVSSSSSRQNHHGLEIEAAAVAVVAAEKTRAVTVPQATASKPNKTSKSRQTSKPSNVKPPAAAEAAAAVTTQVESLKPSESLVPDAFTDILEQAFANDDMRAVSNPLPSSVQPRAVEQQRRVTSMPTPEASSMSGRFEQFQSAAGPPRPHEEFLPMIFEEEHTYESELKVDRRRAPQLTFGTNTPAVHLSFTPSEAAAAVSAPVRPAPRAPSSRPSYSTRDPGNSQGIFNPYSVVPQVVLEPKSGTATKSFVPISTRRKPVPQPIDAPQFKGDWLSEADQLSKFSETESPWDSKFFSIAQRPITPPSDSPRRKSVPAPVSAPVDATVDASVTTNATNDNARLSSPGANRIKRQPLGERDSNIITKPEESAKKSMLQRFGRRRTSENEKTAKTMIVSSSNYNVSDTKKKETVASTARRVPTPIIHEEPKQSWLLRVLALNSGTTQTTSAKSLFSHLPEERLLAVITGIMDGWQRYGISYANSGSVLTAHISPKNVLKLHQATFGVRVEPSTSTNKGSIALFQLQRGSKVAFQRYVNELERCLDNAGLLG